jgi:hypothetical protein
MIWVLYSLLLLHGPGEQMIVINPEHVVELRVPKEEEHFARGTRCIVNTTDGKFATVKEECHVVQEMIESMGKR